MGSFGAIFCFNRRNQWHNFILLGFNSSSRSSGRRPRSHNERSELGLRTPALRQRFFSSSKVQEDQELRPAKLSSKKHSTQFSMTLRGFALLPTVWLVWVLAHYGEGRSVPHVSETASSPSKAEPSRRECSPMKSFLCGCEPCRAENDHQCECAPTNQAATAVPSAANEFRKKAIPGATDSSWSTTAAVAAASLDVSADAVGQFRRIFGIPGTVLGRTLLQEKPGWSPGVITTLEPKTSVQVLCKRADASVKDDPWWLQVHVWSTGLEGWVADFWVLCRHTTGNCPVPFCVD